MKGKRGRAGSDSSSGENSSDEEEYLAELAAAGRLRPAGAGAGAGAGAAAAGGAGARKHVNDVAGLRRALEEVRNGDLPWIERLEVVSAEPLAVQDAGDDLKLELAL